MRIHFYDTAKVNSAYISGFESNIREIVLRNKILVNGPFTKIFEEKLSEYVDSKYCVHVSSGLDALRLSLRSHGIGCGDRVLLPAHSYIAAWIPVLELGAIPVGIKVDEGSLLLSLEELNSTDLTNINAIIPVHLYGQACDIDKIGKLTEKYQIPIIEDAAQAHGAVINGKKIGSHNTSTCFSFYPTKNLGGLGEGGAIATSNRDIYEHICSLRNYGREGHGTGIYEYVSGNYRGDEIQAAFLIEKLKHLERINAKRCSLLQTYRDNLSSVNEQSLALLNTDQSGAAHIALVRTKDRRIRDGLKRYLSEKGVDSIIHYPVAVSEQPCMKHQKIEISDEARDQAIQISNTILSLPLHEGLKKEEIDYISKCILEYIGYE